MQKAIAGRSDAHLDSKGEERATGSGQGAPTWHASARGAECGDRPRTVAEAKHARLRFGTIIAIGLAASSLWLWIVPSSVPVFRAPGESYACGNVFTQEFDGTATDDLGNLVSVPDTRTPTQQLYDAGCAEHRDRKSVV